VNLDDLPDVATAEEVAEVLRCSPWKVYDLAKNGQLPCIPLGRLKRFPKGGVVRLATGEPQP
jgi:excisionase family DNA binding protein